MLPPEGQLSSGRKGALAALWYEVGLLERLLYKNKNQHRHTLHFQRLQQVHRILMIVRRSSIATPALEGLLGPKSDGAALTWLGSRDPQRGLGILRLLEQLLSAIEAASKALGALLAQSFFMPFALTVLACLARIHTIASQAAERFKGRGDTATGELEAARDSTAPFTARNLDPQLSSGTPPPVQPLRPEGPVHPVREALQAAVVPERYEIVPETGPPGFSVPPFDIRGVDETGADEGVLESPPAKRVRLSDEERGLVVLPGGVNVLSQEGTAQEHGIVSSTAGGLPLETGKVPPIGNEEVLKSETSINPVSQTAKADEFERKKRAAAWLEDLGLEARTPTKNTLQIEKTFSGPQEHRKSGPLQGSVTKDASKLRNLASDLLAGTDFEGFGGSESVEKRGKKKLRRNRA